MDTLSAHYAPDRFIAVVLSLTSPEGLQCAMPREMVLAATQKTVQPARWSMKAPCCTSLPPLGPLIGGASRMQKLRSPPASRQLFPKPSFGAPGRVGDTASVREKCCVDYVQEWMFLSKPELLPITSRRNEW